MAKEIAEEVTLAIVDREIKKSTVDAVRFEDMTTVVKKSREE